MTSLTGKVALVTGASRGLGRAVALALVSEGAHVLALARTMGALEELDDAAQARGGSGSVTIVPLDLTDDEGVDRMGAALHERWGRLDILVHCAAHAAPLTPVAHAAAKDFDMSFAVNARAVQRLIRSLDPLLTASDSGRAVFVADEKIDQAYWAPYAASKAAGAVIARAYATEKQRSQVSVHLYHPPAMPTALRARFYPGEDRTMLVKPEDVAEDMIGVLAKAP